MGLCSLGFSSSLTSCEAYGGMLSIEGPSAPLFVLPFGITLLLLPVCRDVTMLAGVRAAVAPPPVANPGTATGTAAASCGHGRYTADSIAGVIFPRDAGSQVTMQLSATQTP